MNTMFRPKNNQTVHTFLQTKRSEGQGETNDDKYTITRLCETFGSNARESYARSMVTTQVIGGKVYWQSRDYKGWKWVRRQPPPLTKNGLPTKVLYNYNRDTVYRYVFVLHRHDVALLTPHISVYI